MASDAETMLNAMRQQIETQASAMNEFQRQLLETRAQLAQSEALRQNELTGILQSQQALISKLTEVSSSSSSTDVSLVDTRGIAKPSTFQSDRKNWPAWSFRMSNFLEGAVTGITRALDWAADETNEIDDDRESDDMDALRGVMNESMSTEK